jgi:hypothetical protein
MVTNKALKIIRAFILEVRAFCCHNRLLNECDEFEYGQIHGDDDKTRQNLPERASA